MLGEGPLFFVILPVVVAIYFIASIIGVFLVGGFRNQKKQYWIIDILLWLAVTPIALGLYYISLRVSWDTPIGHPAVILLLFPAIIGILLGTAIGGFKKLFKPQNV